MRGRTKQQKTKHKINRKRIKAPRKNERNMKNWKLSKQKTTEGENGRKKEVGNGKTKERTGNVTTEGSKRRIKFPYHYFDCLSLLSYRYKYAPPNPSFLM
jgi:hypothetical protein